MQSGLELVLWEDLSEVERFSAQSQETLTAIMDAIKGGVIGQPTRVDSKHLNRLVVLSEMVCNEIKQWADEIDARRQELQAFKQQHGAR